MALRVEGETRQLANHFAGQRIERRQAFHLVIEQLDANGLQVGFRREDIDDIAANPEGGAGEVHVVAGVLQLRQTTQQSALVDPVATVDVQHHLQVGRRVTQTIDGGDGGDDDGVRPLQ
ncbi:hypothetical protein D3C85_569970 [compost metagenome]